MTTTTVQAPIKTRTVRPFVAFLVALLGLGVLVVWSASFPGVPFSLVLLSVLLGVAVLVLGLRVTRRPGPLTVAAGAVVLVIAATVALAGSDAPLRARFAASQADFEAAVAGLPAPAQDNSEAWGTFPGECPAQVGSYTFIDCHGFDSGYLFEQRAGAITDVSGIAYLPTGPLVREDGGTDSGLTHLTGPWYAWTCNC